jgi:hypothetical protein
MVVDKRSHSRIIRSDFDQYVKEKAAFNLTIVHENSEYNKCLQAADFIAGAIYRKYESGDSRFYKLIEEKITVAEHLL